VGVYEDCDLIDRSIQQLQVEWDKFFSGVEKKPPSDLMGRVEQLVKRYAYAEIKNSGERFRYQSVTTRFNTFKELWNKRMRAREEGRVVGLHVTPALAHTLHLPSTTDPLEALLKSGGFQTKAQMAAGGGEGPRPEDLAAVAAKAAQRAAAARAEVRIQDPQRDTAAVQALYEKFSAARQASGEGSPAAGSFQNLIAQQTKRILSEKGGSAVEFRVETKDGKVSLKAKLIR